MELYMAALQAFGLQTGAVVVPTVVCGFAVVVPAVVVEVVPGPIVVVPGVVLVVPGLIVDALGVVELGSSFFVTKRYAMLLEEHIQQHAIIRPDPANRITALLELMVWYTYV